MLKSILILGAGRSSSSLIHYLINAAKLNAWDITVGDFSVEAARERMRDGDGQAIQFDITTPESRDTIAKADVVVSLIPAHLHPLVAKLCLQEGKHLVTASYVSDEMKAFGKEANEKGLLFLNECGLDPGIDHMSAMQVIDNIKARGGKLLTFESFTGGLIAPETDPQNPWRYKFTWNPRNVVMAGQGTAKFLQDGKYKFIPYQQLFKRTTTISVPGYGEYEGYANRDSLKYLESYGIAGIQTMVRGTLRNKGYCSAWNVLVQLGCCDDSYLIDNLDSFTHQDFLSLYINSNSTSLEAALCTQFGLLPDGEEMKRLRWSGFFSDEKIGLSQGTPAQVLEYILQKRWKLVPGDKDFIVMWHRFGFKQDGKNKVIEAYLTCTGINENNTAMSQTVGLPLAIATKLLMQGKIKSRGVVVPISQEFYKPILQELGTLGIKLEELEL